MSKVVKDLSFLKIVIFDDIFDRNKIQENHDLIENIINEIKNAPEKKHFEFEVPYRYISIINEKLTDRRVSHMQELLINSVQSTSILWNAIAEYLSSDIFESLIELFIPGKMETLRDQVTKRNQYDTKLVRKYMYSVFTLIDMLTNNQIYIGVEDGPRKLRYSGYDATKIITMNLSFGIIGYYYQKHVDRAIEAFVSETFSEFRKKITSITSGINNRIFIDSVQRVGYVVFRDNVQFDESIIEHINKTFGYNLNEVTMNSIINYKSNKAINQVLFSNVLGLNTSFEQMDDNDLGINIYYFIENVTKYHGEKVSFKVIDYIFKELSKEKYFTNIVENNLSLVYLDDDYFEKIEQGAFQKNSRIFRNEVDKAKYKNFLIYPHNIQSDIEEYAIRGKNTLSEILEINFGTRADEINELLKNPNVKLKYSKSDKTIKDEILFYTLIILNHNSDKTFIESIYPEYFSDDNNYKRLSIIAEICKEIYPDNYAGEFLNNFYELFTDICEINNVETLHQKNKEIRNTNFEKLKKKLSNYNIEVKEENKFYYICSLLDRKVATYSEIDTFPYLEQIGDAIYDMAIEEIKFYNSVDSKGVENNISNIEKLDLASAEDQIKVAKLLDIEKLYIDITNSLDEHRKTNEYGYLDERSYKGRSNFYADSLEMIIGCICIDNGAEKAIKFAKDLIGEAYNIDYTTKPKLDVMELVDSNLDYDYIGRIYPSIRDVRHESHKFRVLDKLLKILMVGNDTKEKRVWINSNKYNTSIFEFSKNDDNYIEDFTAYIYDYLYFGVDFVIEKYKEYVMENYAKLSSVG